MAEEENFQNSSDDRERFPPMGMGKQDFRDAAHKMVDIILDYHESLENGNRPALPDVKPGFMRNRVSEEAPLTAQKWEEVFKDIEKVVFEGSMHWQSTNNLGYFAASCSYPATLGDFLIGALGQIGFTWFSSPACTELETVMMDWLAKALGLPEFFIHDGKGPGGGVIQSTASEATVMTLLSSRTKMIGQEQARDPTQSIHEITHRMVAYASKCSHSSVERAGKITMVQMRLLNVDDGAFLSAETLKRAIEEDVKDGKFPVYVCVTLGTTSCCTFDQLNEIGDVCLDHNIWLHVDAAYAGSAFLCPEFRHLAKGLEPAPVMTMFDQKATSFVFNPHKWILVNFDCSALWVRDTQDIENSMKIVPLYLQHEEQDKVIDYMHWQIPLGRRFRSIKLWFTLRMVGLEGLRHNIRAGVARGKFFEQLVLSDERFEVLFPVTLALVCFRLVIPNKTNEELNKLNQLLNRRIVLDRTFLITPSEVNDVYFLRVSTGISFCTNTAIKKFWKLLLQKTQEILEENAQNLENVTS